MDGPYIGTGGYNPTGGYHNSYIPPQLENVAGSVFGDAGVVRNGSGNIATKVDQALGGYERFLLGEQKNPGPITEYALLILGTHVRRYASQEMFRYEKVLDGLRDRVNVDWVKDLLYGEYKHVGIGATVGDPKVKVPLQLHNQS